MKRIETQANYDLLPRERRFLTAASSYVGNTLDYVYEVDKDTLTIWGGQKGSPAYFKGTFSDDGNTCTGGWVYPGGGGYKSTMTRVKK